MTIACGVVQPVLRSPVPAAGVAAGPCRSRPEPHSARQRRLHQWPAAAPRRTVAAIRPIPRTLAIRACRETGLRAQDHGSSRLRDRSHAERAFCFIARAHRRRQSRYLSAWLFALFDEWIARRQRCHGACRRPTWPRPAERRHASCSFHSSIDPERSWQTSQCCRTQVRLGDQASRLAHGFARIGGLDGVAGTYGCMTGRRGSDAGRESVFQRRKHEQRAERQRKTPIVAVAIDRVCGCVAERAPAGPRRAQR